MKVYQIHEYGGSWEDKFDYIRFTYLDPDKATEKMKELGSKEEILRKCNVCPLDYCPDDCELDCKLCTKENGIARAMKYCERCDIEKIEDKNSPEGYFIRCRNEVSHYDNSYFKIEEIDVIE